MTTVAYARQLGFLIHYSSPNGTALDFQYGRDLFEAVSRFRLNGRRKASSIQAIRQIGREHSEA